MHFIIFDNYSLIVIDFLRPISNLYLPEAVVQHFSNIISHVVSWLLNRNVASSILQLR